MPDSIPGWDLLKSLPADVRTLKAVSKIIIPILSQALQLSGLKDIGGFQYSSTDGDKIAMYGPVGRSTWLTPAADAEWLAQFAADLPKLVELLAADPRVKSVVALAPKLAKIGRELG